MNKDEYLPPQEAPKDFLDEVERKIKAYTKRLEKLKPGVDDDLERWLEQLDAFEPDENTSDEERFDHSRQKRLAEQTELTLEQLQDKIDGVDPSKKQKTAKGVVEDTYGEGEDGEDGEENTGDDDVDEVDDLELPVFDEDDSPSVKRWKLLREEIAKDGGPVSYTHLTLPTTPYV